MSNLTMVLLLGVAAYKGSPHMELLVKMRVRDDAPGKFRAPFAEWNASRRRFVVPYAITGLLYVVLCSHPRW